MPFPGHMTPPFKRFLAEGVREIGRIEKEDWRRLAPDIAKRGILTSPVSAEIRRPLLETAQRAKTELAADVGLQAFQRWQKVEEREDIQEFQVGQLGRQIAGQRGIAELQQRGAMERLEKTITAEIEAAGLRREWEAVKLEEAGSGRWWTAMTTIAGAIAGGPAGGALVEWLQSALKGDGFVSEVIPELTAVAGMEV